MLLHLLFLSQSLIRMKNFIAVTTAFLIIFSAISCKNSDTTAKVSSAPVAIPLPNTPEDVVRTWETQIGLNQFADAKLISIGKTLETVVSLDSTNRMDKITPSTSKILSIVCKTEGDKSQCDCLLEDAVGQLTCKYYLVQQNGQWYLQDADSAPVEPVSAKSKENHNKKPTNLVK